MAENALSEMDVLWQDFRKKISVRKATRLVGYSLVTGALLSSEEVDVTIGSVLDDISSIYGFSYVFEDESLRDRKLSLQGREDVTPADIVRLLEIVCGVGAEYSDNVIKISSR